MSDVPGIYTKFKTYVKATGASYPDAAVVPILESTERRYPWTGCLLRARDSRRLRGPADGFKTKIKWKTAKGYGPRLPGTPVTWQRRGSLEFLSTNYCQEFGTLQFIEDEVKKQVGSVWSAESMAQQFDDILQNYFQDLHVDITETIEETTSRVPTELMEDGEANVPRSIFMGMNEWKTAHGGVADGCLPGITSIENYDPTTAGAKMAATVVSYSEVGSEDGMAPGHFFEAFTRGLREVDFRAVPLAEKYTQGTEGFSECFTSLEGILLSRRTLAAQDNVIAEESFNNVYSLESRMKGLTMIDVPGQEDWAGCPDYTITTGAPATSTSTYVAGALDQVYKTEQTSAYGKGPRFYIPYQPHIRPIWDEENFMRKSPIYALEETVPDAMVCWVKNDRNLHFQSFRRNLVIRPDSSVSDLGYGTA